MLVGSGTTLQWGGEVRRASMLGRVSRVAAVAPVRAAKIVSTLERVYGKFARVEHAHIIAVSSI